MVNANGPSAMSMSSAAGAEPRRNRDPGLDMGGNLEARSLAARGHFAEPAEMPEATLNYDANVPYYYNMGGAPPVKYTIPSAQKERLVARQAVREATPVGGATLRTDPITDEEVTYLQDMKALAEKADFDNYVTRLLDPRQPGQLRILMDLYPQYVHERIQQSHTDHEFALRNDLIDMWGINTFDDLHFKYLVDQGKISGPTLQRSTNLNAEYTPGMLSPFRFLDRRQPDGLKLPFASAKFGARPANNDPEYWSIEDTGPLSSNRSMGELARSMYRNPSPANF
ncbi:hypothetical protein [Pleurochrysis sp. endemic virus 1a]|nr:hypothetical protein [Pleurochrysis sp. endemic virus 1a]